MPGAVPGAAALSGKKIFVSLRNSWFSNIRGDLLAGLVVALALIPEAIAFSIIAGLDPKVGLYASFCIAVVIAFVGGRPGMVSAATGAMALLMVTLVKEHGLQYLLAATLLTGVLQIGAGYFRLGSLMRFVSRSVVTGFVNALAILIFMAQLPELTNPIAHQRHGSLLDSLLAIEQDTRLLVLGKHDEHLGEHVGSRLETVVRALHRPILVCTSVFKAPQRVMFAFDGSATTHKAVDMVAGSPLCSAACPATS